MAARVEIHLSFIEHLAPTLSHLYPLLKSQIRTGTQTLNIRALLNTSRVFE